LEPLARSLYLWPQQEVSQHDDGFVQPSVLAYEGPHSDPRGGDVHRDVLISSRALGLVPERNLSSFQIINRG
jgi:hypothetical protein